MKLSLIHISLKTQSKPWKTKYAFLGINLCGSTLFFDGVNEKGLAGGLLFLKACTWDKKENIEKQGLIAINSGEIVTWILSNFESCLLYTSRSCYFRKWFKG